MFARTQRLTLRPLWMEDAEAITQAIAHEAVVYKLARVPWPYRLDDARAWLGRAPQTGEATLAVLAHEGAARPRLIGVIGIHPEGDGHEFGYWLTPSAWGRGYATEAGRAMLGIARHAMGLRELRSSHFVDNPASARVLCKLGFRPSGEPVSRFCLASGDERPSVPLAIDLLAEAQTPTDADCRHAA